MTTTVTTTSGFALASLGLLSTLLLLGCSSTTEEPKPRDGFDTAQAAIEAGVEAMIAVDADALYVSLPPESDPAEAEAFVAGLNEAEMEQVGDTLVTGLNKNAEETLATAWVRVLSNDGQVLTESRMGAIRVNERWYFGGAIPAGE